MRFPMWIETKIADAAAGDEAAALWVAKHTILTGVWLLSLPFVIYWFYR